MHIAYILTSLGVGGAERHTLALAERMQARGHQVCVLVLGKPRADSCRTGLPVFVLGMRKNAADAVRGYARAVRYLRSFQPDVLHTHNVHGNLFGRLLRLALPSVSVISTIHNEYEGGWPRMLAYRLTDPLCDRSVAVCEAARRRFVRLGAVPRQKCAVIPNGIDPHGFAPEAGRRATVRQQRGVGGRFVWITAARVAAAKDYANLLHAFAMVCGAIPQAELWVAGEGNSAYAGSMRALSRRLGIEDAVRWMGVTEEMPAVFDAADGFVLASAWEGMPLALGEAMAMEKTIVATDVGGVRELAGDCATLVLPHRPTLLGRAMIDAMGRCGEERAKRGRAARARILREFSMETRVTEFEALYAGLRSTKTAGANAPAALN